MWVFVAIFLKVAENLNNFKCTLNELIVDVHTMAYSAIEGTGLEFCWPGVI